jgi:hypothetical protein
VYDPDSLTRPVSGYRAWPGVAIGVSSVSRVAEAIGVCADGWVKVCGWGHNAINARSVVLNEFKQSERLAL